jgi:hypothetical protein
MNLKCSLEQFRVAPGKKVNLARWPTRVEPFSPSKKHYRKLLEEYREEIGDLQRAYADCLGATSTKRAPWYVVPADDKHNARLIISHAIVETMKSLELNYPEATGAPRRALQTVRQRLEHEAER